MLPTIKFQRTLLLYDDALQVTFRIYQAECALKSRLGVTLDKVDLSEYSALTKPPSVTLLSPRVTTFVLRYFEKMKLFYAEQMLQLGAIVISVEHTYKVVKRMLRKEGRKSMLLYRALYILLNQDRMVVAHYLCDDATQADVTQFLKDLQCRPASKCGIRESGSFHACATFLMLTRLDRLQSPAPLLPRY